MKTYINNDTGLLTLAPTAIQTIKRIEAKHVLILDVIPSADFAEGTTGILCAKQKAIYSGNPVALNLSWQAIAPAGYRFSLSLHTDELIALFVGEISEVVLIADITITEPGKEPIGSQTFEVVASRPVWRGDEATPTPANPLAPVVMTATAVPTSEDDFFMFPGGVAPSIGQYNIISGNFLYVITGGQNKWSRIQISGWTP